MKIYTFLVVFSVWLAVSIDANAQVPTNVPTNGLVAWYSFDGNVNDLSGNGNTPVNTGAMFTTDRFGNANSALDFDGASAVMTLNAPSFTFSETGQFTFSAWINKRTQNSAGVVLMSGSTTAGNFITNIQGNSNFQFGANQQQSAWTWATCAHVLNEWDHYVCTYNNGLMIIFRNGVLQTLASRSPSGALSVNLPFYFGRGLPGGGNNFNGELDEIGIWTRALTQTEITNLYSFSSSVNSVSLSKNVSVYPNPASENLMIDCGGSFNDFNGYSITIINTLGQTIYNSPITTATTNISLTAPQWVSGTYLVQFINAQGIITENRRISIQ
ncbi:MAG: hypothetical protein RIQ47_671 [Bacteroidota bacterium]